MNLEDLKILVVDDDELNRFGLEMLLEDYNMKASYLDSGVKAVETVRSDDSFDLVLMDFQMPDKDGLEAIREIREFNKEVIIYSLTAYASDDIEDRILDAGAQAYHSKPISIEKLIANIKKDFSIA